jgi:23S rRNA (adenine2503-C2)-methyltransferase
MVAANVPADGGKPRRRELPGLNLLELEQELTALGQPGYRARQVYAWLHAKGVLDPERMTDLPAGLRATLAESFVTRPLALKRRIKSSDGALKLLWATTAGHPVEAVMMPGFDYGAALCLSVQSGCPLNCNFCLTGRMGLLENLNPAAILAQLYGAEEEAGFAADRLVFMGMGEPLLRLHALRQVIAVLTGPGGREWSPRRITVSTVGLVKPMLEMANTFPRVNLALSLHFTTNEQRSRYMPKGEERISELTGALYYYRRVNGGKLTLEYSLLERINDSEEDAQRLVRIARLAGIKPDSDIVLEAESHPPMDHSQALPLHVNLIEFNPAPGLGFRPSPPERSNAFAKFLRDAGVNVTVRHSRGRDIGAACGQLGMDLVK